MTDFARERSRQSDQVSTLLGTSTSYSNGILLSSSDKFHICRRSIERCRDEKHPNHPYTGGPLDIQKCKVSFSDGSGRDGAHYIHPSEGLTGSSYMGRYRYTSLGDAVLPASLHTVCEGYGPTAWSKFRPGQPDVSLSVFVAELRDIPGLMLRRLNKFRNLGSNYLAVQFGWKPFLSDLRKWYTSILDVDRRARQLIRDNGRRIRRGGTVFQQSETKIVRSSTPACYPASNQTIPCGTDIQTTISEKCWFSGSFRYYIPGLANTQLGKAKAIAHLWDLELGPEQVWQLLPWSWLIDWFSNVGDVVGNFAAATEDNLVSQYAYVMLHKRTTIEAHSYTTLKYRSQFIGGYEYSPLSVRAKMVTETKSRVPANPYGFNASWSGLSNYQTSILAALGISRLHF